MLNKKFISAVGIIVGMIIGSGVYALPYVVAQSGIMWSLLGLIAALGLTLIMHLSYAEVVLRTPTRHRLPGYVKHYFGSVAGGIETILILVSFHLILLSYIILAGLFISQIVYISAFSAAIVFVVAMNLLLLKPASAIGELNLVLLIPFVFMVALIGYLGISAGAWSNVPTPVNQGFYLPFTVILFALTGYSVVPDGLSIYGHKLQTADAVRVVNVSTVLPILLYVPFVIGVIMISGHNVSPDSLQGLSDHLGSSVLRLGALVGLLVIATSYLSLGFDIKSVYRLDVKLSSWISWLLVAILPIIPYLLNYHNFIQALSIVGGLLIAIDGAFIMTMLWLSRKKYAGLIQIAPLGNTAIAATTLGFVASAAYAIIGVI